ncbi:Hydrolase tropI [Pseudocercospora fuligena]|uniref:Hydrolase tropI n=1 Tax=Pseudocercospora fuligena TaxID=685502 RepID=A0A8H6RA79_9PEZI|nr:Hydrolase tropI [Pseudocercospora fuligena]
MSLKPCCATGSLHTGTPTGRIEKVQGLDCYIADAPNGNPKGVIVIIPDAFGWTLPNNRILADDYAKNGFQVYLPEFMQGIAIPLDLLVSMKALQETGFWAQIDKVRHLAYMMWHFLPFMLYNRPAVAGPRVYDFIKALKKNEAKDLPLGTAGFCWGGYFVTQLCHNRIKADDGNRLTDCGFVAHPSFLTFPKDIEGIELPYSCAAAQGAQGSKGGDPQMPPEAAKQTEEILKAKTAKMKDQGIEHEFIMYEGASHGFAVRADEDDKEEAARGKKAEEQAVQWFSRWFANPPPIL